VIAAIVGAASVAELRLWRYSFAELSVQSSTQGLLLDARDRLRGRRLFREAWDRADRIVALGLVRAEPALAATADDFVRLSDPGDYFLADAGLARPGLEYLARRGEVALYRRRD
jgi:hypothetical protein